MLEPICKDECGGAWTGGCSAARESAKNAHLSTANKRPTNAHRDDPQRDGTTRLNQPDVAFSVMLATLQTAYKSLCGPKDTPCASPCLYNDGP